MIDPTDEASVIPELTSDNYQRHKEDGVIAGGMIPKLDNAFAAIDAGVYQISIGHIEALQQKQATRILREA